MVRTKQVSNFPPANACDPPTPSPRCICRDFQKNEARNGPAAVAQGHSKLCSLRTLSRTNLAFSPSYSESITMASSATSSKMALPVVDRRGDDRVP